MPTVQQISRHAKRTRKRGEKWIHAIKRSSKELQGSRTHKAKRRKISGIKTVSKSHTDKNRVTANIQIGTISAAKSLVRKNLRERLGDKLLKASLATSKRQRKNYRKEAANIKRELKKYS